MNTSLPSSMMPDRLFVVSVASDRRQLMGFKNSVFGFQKQHLATRTIDFLQNARPDVFYTHMRPNACRMRRRRLDGSASDASDDAAFLLGPPRASRYRVSLMDIAEYCESILDKNISIRVVEDVERETDEQELLISSSMKIDPRIADEVEFLEALMRTK
jgi:hypothetical protein